MKPMLTKIALGMTASIIALSAAPNLASAQGGIDEIVVVSRKVAENLQDVPIAVTAFSAADIEDAGIQQPKISSA